MGIQGLLPMLKEVCEQTHIKSWAGKRLAVDAYVWLHKGAYGCAEELAIGKPTLKYVNYAMQRIRLLKHYDITPFIVLDGGLLPSKLGTEDARKKRRTEALAKGKAFLAEGKASLAREAFVKAIDVTPEMAYQFIKALRREGIEYVVAPYEADPQLAYLEKKHIVDGVITEDSDLLVFGCKKVLFKLDGDGNCSEARRSRLTACKEYNFVGWSNTEFRQMAILSGCDYLDSIPGLGLKTAYTLMRRFKNAEKVVQCVRLEGKLKVPREYSEEFKRADLTFRFQRVFDPIERKIVHFEDLPQGMKEEDLPFIGEALDPEYAIALAEGNMDPLKKKPIFDICPDDGSVTASLSGPHGESIRGHHVEPPKVSIRDFFKPETSAASLSRPAAAKSVLQRIGGDNKPKGGEFGRILAANEGVANLRSKFFGSSKDKSATVVGDVDINDLKDTPAQAARIVQLSLPGACPLEVASLEERDGGGVSNTHESFQEELMGPEQQASDQSLQDFNTKAPSGSDTLLSAEVVQIDCVASRNRIRSAETPTSSAMIITSPVSSALPTKRRRLNDDAKENSAPSLPSDIVAISSPLHEAIKAEKQDMYADFVSSPTGTFRDVKPKAEAKIDDGDGMSKIRFKVENTEAKPTIREPSKRAKVEHVSTDEVSGNAASIASDWRKRFTLKPGASITPRPRTPTTAFPHSLPTPTHTRPFAASQVRARNSKELPDPLCSQRPRLPLSPKSTNAKAQSTTQYSSYGSSSSSLDETTHKSGAGAAGVSSGRMVIIPSKIERGATPAGCVPVSNSALLAFQFRGVLSQSQK